MNRKHAVPAAGRRSFLKGIAAAGGATAITAVFASRLVASDTGGTALRKVKEPLASRGYHETDHIRDFYRTLRM
jgi:hypothetical protein